jgi:hypothetical protein
MPRTHVVIEGETLASIALAEGFHDAAKLFDAPENAPLREARSSPEQIQPGDEVVIPDLVPFKALARSGHSLVLQRQPQGAPPQVPEIHFVQLVVVDADNEPIADEQVIVTDSTGKEHRATSDALGQVSIEGLPEGEVQVSLFNRNGDDWSVQGLA